MGNHAEETRNTGRKSLVTTLAALAVLGIAALLAGPRLQAQSTSSHAEEVQPETPRWQADAGGKKAFDVASVKQNAAAPSPSTVNSNIPLGPGDYYYSYRRPLLGNQFSADCVRVICIQAYG